MTDAHAECRRRPPCREASSLEVSFPLAGHHETPLSASTKVLERFPNNLPKHRENVIPADVDKKSFEEVSGQVDRGFLSPAGGADAHRGARPSESEGTWGDAVAQV